ncbi:MAG TPA: C39 family peptidase [Alphaproteobacteria bacterium]|nr:C39 family peptidase [Alphaproteobacteria bacterium]
MRSLLEMRQQNVVMQKWDNSCGAAALATVLTYHLHYPVDENTVARGLLRQTEPLKVRYRGGFSLLDMKRYLADIGFEGDGYSDLSWDDLPAYTPAVVPIKLRGYDHFIVVRGISGSEAAIADPGFGNYTLGKSEFLRAWTSGIAFVVTTGEGTGSHDQGLESRGGDRPSGGTNDGFGADGAGAAAPGR